MRLAADLLPFTLPEELEEELRSAYGSPVREYHNFGHVESVLREHRCVSDFQDPTSSALAVLFHDAVMVPGRTDNEEESAKLARKMIKIHLPFFSSKLPKVEEMIRLTARHGELETGSVSHDASLFLDCDMAILGSSPEKFDAYEEAIRKEYSWVPDEAFRAGRAAFLEKLLRKQSIFLSGHFERLEGRARKNVEGALLRLHPDGA